MLKYRILALSEKKYLKNLTFWQKNFLEYFYSFQMVCIFVFLSDFMRHSFTKKALLKLF